jgi:hypothetical protein
VSWWSSPFGDRMVAAMDRPAPLLVQTTISLEIEESAQESPLSSLLCSRQPPHHSKVMSVPSASNARSAKNGGSSSRGYDTLLSIVDKALTSSREKIARDAPHIIKESYGDLTSLFTSSDDSDGISRLVDLLLGKLDSVHDRFGSEKSPSTSLTQLEELLQQQNILEVLQKVESAIDEVENAERKFNEADAADKNSAKEAIKLAKTSRMSPSGKKRRVLPAESIGYQAYRLKLEYQQSLAQELKEVEEENEKLESELQSGWTMWEKNVEGVRSALSVMDTLGEGNDDDELAQD